jgi:hypothetical protein
MRATASLCVELARTGGCDLLLPGERRTITLDPAMRSWPEAHVRIAVCDQNAGPMATPALRGSAVLWVTAGRGLPGALRGLRGGSFLVTPVGSRRAAWFRVAGCFGYPIDATAEARDARRRAA